MQSTWTFVSKRDFTGGENKLIVPELMKPNQVISALNCVMTPDGTFQTRRGRTKVNLTSLGSGPVLSIHRYPKEDGTNYLVVQHGTSLYSATWDGLNTISTFGTAVKTGLSSNKLRGVVWRDKLILTNGVDNPFYFDGTTCVDLAGSPPKSKYIAVYGSKLWFVDVDHPNWIRFSGLEDYDSWDALDIIYLRDGDGDFITGLAPMNGGMIITKNRSVWPLYGTSRYDFAVPGPISERVGCIAPDSLVQQGLFMGQDNFYTFTLTGVQEIADTHRPTIEMLSQAEKEAVICIGMPSENRVIAKLGTGYLNFDGRYSGITTWSGLEANCFSTANAQGDSGNLLVGDDTNGYVYILTNLENDDGNLIPTEIVTPYDDFGSLHPKVWRWARPEVQPMSEGEFNVFASYDVDYSKLYESSRLTDNFYGGLIWGSDKWLEGTFAPTNSFVDWGTSIRFSDYYFLHGVRGERISFTFKTYNRVKLIGFTCKYREAGAR